MCFSGKNFRTWVWIDPTHSHLWCDAVPIELPSPWEQAGGEKGDSWRKGIQGYASASFPPHCSQGLGSSLTIGRASHWRCAECAGSIPTQKSQDFFKEKNLVAIQALRIILACWLIPRGLPSGFMFLYCIQTSEIGTVCSPQFLSLLMHKLWFIV